MLSNYRRRTKLPDNSLSVLASEDAPALKPGDLSHLLAEQSEAAEGASCSSPELGAADEEELPPSVKSQLQDIVDGGHEETIQVGDADDAVCEPASASSSHRCSSVPHYLAIRETTPSPAPRKHIHQPQRARSQQARSSQAARQRITSISVPPHQPSTSSRVNLARFARRSKEPSIFGLALKHDREAEEEEEVPRAKRSRPNSLSSQADASLFQPMNDAASPQSSEQTNLPTTPLHQSPSCQESPQLDIALTLTAPDVAADKVTPQEGRASVSWSFPPNLVATILNHRPDIDNRLDNIIINDILELLTACGPNTFILRSSAVPGSECFQVLRSAMQFHASYGISNIEQTVVYFPIHIKGNTQQPSENQPRDTSQDHWLLAVYQLRKKRCIWLDSLPSQDHYKKAESTVKSVIEHVMPQGWNVFSDWTNEHPPTMQQQNGVDCGVAVVAHALYHLCGRTDWPLILETTAWRSVLLALAQAMTGASPDESHMTGFLSQTCDLESQLQIVRGESQDASRHTSNPDTNGINLRESNTS